VTQTQTVRIGTWNIHGGIGSDRRFDMGRVTSCIKSRQVAVWAIQEVDSRASRARGIDGFDVISAACGGHAAAARTLRSHEGDYGHMLAARWPIERITIHDVTHRRREPRHLIEGRIAGGLVPLRVFAVHLDLGRRARHAQLAHMSELLDESGAEPCVALGDFNTPRVGTAERMLAKHLHPVPSGATFPARWPLLRLDRIWCRPAGLIRSIEVPRACAWASDHLPVVGEIDTALWHPFDEEAERAQAPGVQAG
jgi:endonuclease/exonuclease/phosphatase family metal-dependent hydrolase